VLKSGTRSRHDIGVTLEIDAGVPVSVRSPSHQIRTQSNGQLIRVPLGGEDTILKVDWIGRPAEVGNTQPEIYPASPPDLFANQPLVLFGRQEYRNPGTLRITGTAAVVSATKRR
jgi:Ca-activated chloride channel family protein